MRVALGTSTRLGIAEAAEEAVARIRPQLGGREPAAVLVAATAAWGQAGLPHLISDVAARCGAAAVAGGSVDGLLAGEGWVAGRPGLAVLALADVEAVAFGIESLAGDEARAGEELRADLPGPAVPGEVIVTFVDSLGLAAEPLLAGLAPSVAAGYGLIGLGAAATEGGGPLVWAGGDVFDEGLAGLVIRSPNPPGLLVASACRAESVDYTVSRSRGHWVLGLDGRPALDVLREVFGPEGAGLVGVVGIEHAGDPLDAPRVREIVGREDSMGGFALAEAVEVGASLRFLAIDAEAARADLQRRLDGAETCPEAGFGLFLTCQASASPLLDAAYSDRALSRALGPAPMLGLSGPYQLAPAPGHGGVWLHTHSGVLALLG